MDVNESTRIDIVLGEAGSGDKGVSSEFKLSRCGAHGNRIGQSHTAIVLVAFVEHGGGNGDLFSFGDDGTRVGCDCRRIIDVCDSDGDVLRVDTAGRIACLNDHIVDIVQSAVGRRLKIGGRLEGQLAARSIDVE